MTRALGLALAVAVVVCGAGCGSLIFAAGSTLGWQTPPDYELWTSRERVDAQLGEPIERAPLPDGGYLATYRFRQRPEPNAARRYLERDEPLILIEIGATAYFFPIGALLLVLTTTVAAGSVVYDVTHPSYGTVTFTFGPYDTLLHSGPPPQYGSGEDVLRPPAIVELRKGCRSPPEAGPSEPPGQSDDEAVRCLALRLAIWGIE